MFESQREQMKDTVVWNIERGHRLTGPEIGRAERKRTELYHRVRQFMEQYAFLAAPVVQVLPFDVSQPWVTEINGQRMHTYVDWMKSCYFITVTGLPAISVPCGFSAEGLPVGLQIVGRHHDDFGVCSSPTRSRDKPDSGRRGRTLRRPSSSARGEFV